MTDTQKDKKKWGLGKMLNRDKDRAAGATPSTLDSTYGSETSQRESYNSSVVPSMNSSENSNGLKPGDPNTVTKPVYNSEGQVVTTITTTTTTTTTTTGSGQKNENVESQPTGSHSSESVKPSPSIQSEQRPNASTTSNAPSTSAPIVPPKNELRHHDSQPAYQQTPGTSTAGTASGLGAGTSTGIGSGTGSSYGTGSGVGTNNGNTGGSNFSYPRHGTTGATGHSTGTGSTFQGIKAAAAGIHGAGETLRGTLNSTVDRRFNAPPEKVAAHQQVAAYGQQEIDSGRLTHQHAPPQKSHHQQPTHTINGTPFSTGNTSYTSGSGNPPYSSGTSAYPAVDAGYQGSGEHGHTSYGGIPGATEPAKTSSNPLKGILKNSRDSSGR